MGESSKARELYEALRVLEAKAKTARNRSGQRYSRRLAALQADGRDSSLDRRLAEWLHKDFDKAKTPDPGSSERLMAVVQVWSQWAQEPCDECWWRTLLDQTQPPRSPLPAANAPKLAYYPTGYNAWIEQKILPVRLLDRDNELRELAAFCTGEDLPGDSRYVWWQAAPWAGKSALLSEFVLRHRPDGVECVSYFIADRLARNDQEGFAETVMRQLAPLAGQDPGAAGARPEDFPGLCQAAAEACRNRGRRLVLVVDGLDEDNGAATGRPSIAALLPRNPPAGMRVVVTGRPNPPLPTDVSYDHPLRNSQTVRTLAPSPHATDISRMAKRELCRLLKDEQVGVPLLGLLVAARGSLTAVDLANLVGVRPYRVGWLLRGITGRSFISGAQGQAPAPELPIGERPLALGHDELRKEALAALGDVMVFEDQLHAWADDYRAQGWPPDTPAYLLYDYPHMLTSNDDSERLTAIALDPQRQQALLGRASPDAALSDVERSAQMIRRHRPNDLTGLAGLAASRAILTEQGRSLPASIAVAFARLGHPQRARQFALLAPHPAEKAVRLASVARALADAGDQHADQAAETAKDAVWWAERAREESAPSSGDEDEAEAAVAAAAVALITVGYDEGRELLNSLRSPSSYGDVNLLAEMAARAALAARPRNAELAEELLAQAEQHADDVASSHPADPSAPVTAWAFVASVADPTRASRLYERITRYTQSFPPGLTACVVDAAAASALAAGRPQQAQALAQQAARRLKGALTNPEALPERDAGDLTMLLGPILSGVTRALVDTGCVDHARNLVASVPEDRHTSFGIDVRAGARSVLADVHDPADEEPSAEVLARQACRLAEQNRPDEAQRRLHQALQALGPSQKAAAPREWWLITLCTALAAMDRHDDSALLARSLRDPAERVQALAAAAVSATTAGHLSDARCLAHEAADATSSLEGALNFSLIDGAPGIVVSNAQGAAAQALAYAGDRERALALAEETDDADSDRRRRALVAVAAGLRAQDPAGAAGIIDRQLEHLMTTDASQWKLRERIADLAEFLAAVGDADPQCADRIREAVGQVWKKFKASKTRGRAGDFLVLLLLHAPERRADAANALLAWERRCQGIPPWELPTGAIATAHAAFGALAAARESADSLNAPYDRAEALAAVAGYLTGTPTGLREVCASASTAFTQTFHTLALAQMPPDTTQTAQAALPLTTDMLAGDGWHHALPVLARIAPAAVLRVRDIVFAHRQLDAG
ncbi:hypothetical protein [Streptomyces sioyaensis]|uniref:hypothetical protein n=1 Tax=Streptomyces sioyaensis TaxID=67364 RepID=UPI0036E77B76